MTEFEFLLKKQNEIFQICSEEGCDPRTAWIAFLINHDFGIWFNEFEGRPRLTVIQCQAENCLAHSELFV